MSSLLSWWRNTERIQMLTKGLQRRSRWDFFSKDMRLCFCRVLAKFCAWLAERVSSCLLQHILVTVSFGHYDSVWPKWLICWPHPHNNSCPHEEMNKGPEKACVRSVLTNSLEDTSAKYSPQQRHLYFVLTTSQDLSWKLVLIQWHIPRCERTCLVTMLSELTAKRSRLGKEKIKPRTEVQGLSDKVLQALVLSQVASVLLQFSKSQLYIE